jgi:GntR family transcriptional repressor for pyruvate dehydrogenase complex
VDRVVQALRHDIAIGQVARGARLPSGSELAEHFRVSQPTIREALRALEAVGVVEVRHGSGVYVTSNPLEFIENSLQTLLQIENVNILDVVGLRTVLGPYSVRQAVDRATVADLATLEAMEGALEDAAKSGDVHRIADTAIRFQTALSGAAHNPLLFALEGFLIKLLVVLQVHAFDARGTRFWRRWSLSFAADRQRILAALRARDADAAAIAMKTYLDDQRQRYASMPELLSLRLSDPEAVAAIMDTPYGSTDAMIRGIGPPS